MSALFITGLSSGTGFVVGYVYFAWPAGRIVPRIRYRGPMIHSLASRRPALRVHAIGAGCGDAVRHQYASHTAVGGEYRTVRDRRAAVRGGCGGGCPFPQTRRTRGAGPSPRLPPPDRNGRGGRRRRPGGARLGRPTHQRHECVPDDDAGSSVHRGAGVVSLPRDYGSARSGGDVAARRRQPRPDGRSIARDGCTFARSSRCARGDRGLGSRQHAVAPARRA